MRKKAVTLLIWMMVVMTAFTGCTTFDNFEEAFLQKGSTGKETVRIGVMEPKTGNDKEFGELEIRGIEIAHELRGEVLGKDIELIYSDTQSDIYAAESAAEDLIDKDVSVVLGSYGDAVTLTAGRIFRKAKVPAIGITTVNPLITGGNEYYFKVAFSEASQGRAIAKFIHDKLEMNSVGIIKMKDEDAAVEMLNEFTSEFKKLTNDDGCIAAECEIDQVKKNFSDSLKKIDESGVQIVFAPVSLKIAEKIFETADDMGMNKVLFLGPKEWHNEDLLKLQDKYPGLRMAAVSDVLSENKTETAGDVTDTYTQFKEEYKKRYDVKEPPEEAALAFDAYMLAVKAIEDAGSTDHEEVREALSGTQDYQGVSGSISFNSRGEPHKPINVDYVSGKKFLSIYTVKQKDTTDLQEERKKEGEQ